MKQSTRSTFELDNLDVTHFQIERGYYHPLGATPYADGVNFSVFAEHATSVQLLLFRKPDDLEPMLTIQLDPQVNRTFRCWHIFVRRLEPGVHYAYRVEGPQNLHGRGDRYSPRKVLIDPYARGNTNICWDRVAACTPEDNMATSMRSVVIDTKGYDWEGDHPLKRPMNETIIYEMHVGGFTRSPSSGVEYPGTFRGVIEKIPYLKDLGITAVELLPIFDFDEKEVKQIGPDGAPLVNYWGYDPIGFFAPENSYCYSPEEGNHLTEFRDMVKALHKAGIEVILDVVFNHTSEGNEQGPTISFRGLANNCYYMLSPQDRQYYMNYSGCGNTFNANHPITVKLITDCLKFWVLEMHVDGFRFDEATILCRDENGIPMPFPPAIWEVELSETLADTKIIAEAWDAGGLYEVGNFPGYRWGEWNGRYRDIVRRFVKGDQGYVEGSTIVGLLADAIAGSASLFESNNATPINSVNFINAHDGFTLNDLVSYNWKHNEANGEGNRDGINDNLSWNCGFEGETENPEVEALRKRQIKNFATILLFSQGVPMFVSGDEVRRTQKGNNNAYCQNNALSWFDWTQVEKNNEIHRFIKMMITCRKHHSHLCRTGFFAGKVNARGFADISWHGCRLYSPGWYDPNSRVLAFTFGGFPKEDTTEDVDVHVMLNMEWEDLDFDMPPLQERNWYKVVDTAEASPNDIVEDFANPGKHRVVSGNVCRVKNRSAVVLISH